MRILVTLCILISIFTSCSNPNEKYIDHVDSLMVMVDSAKWIAANTPVSSSERPLEDQVLIDAAVWAQQRGGGAPLD